MRKFGRDLHHLKYSHSSAVLQFSAFDTYSNVAATPYAVSFTY